MLSINMDDVINVVNSIKSYLIVIAAALIIGIVAKLEEIGMTAEATIICSHHRKKMDNDPPELALLQAADELN